MKRILLFTTILILCLCSPVWAVDYYVSQSGTGDGSAYATPDSVADFNANVFGALDDDRVFLIAPSGSEITTKITIPDGGTSGHEVYIAACHTDYGASDNAATLPEDCCLITTTTTAIDMNGQDYVKLQGVGITLSGADDIGIEIDDGCDYIEIRECGFTFSGGGAQEYGIKILNENGAGQTYIDIQSCTFTNTTYSYGKGIYILTDTLTSGNKTIDHLTVNNCTFSTMYNGISCNQSAVGNDANAAIYQTILDCDPYSYFTITNNSFDNFKAQALRIQGNNHTIQWNRVTNVGKAYHKTNAFQLSDVDDSVIQYNYINNVCKDVDFVGYTSGDCNGIFLDTHLGWLPPNRAYDIATLSIGNTVSHNWVQNCDPLDFKGIGIVHYHGYDNDVYANILIDNNIGLLCSHDYWETTLTGDARVYNNTFVDNDDSHIYCGKHTDTNKPYYFRNNIFYGGPACFWVDTGISSTTLNEAYSCYYGVTAFQTGAGSLTSTNGITTTPDFNDTATDDYTLKAGSGCIDTADDTLVTPFNTLLNPDTNWSATPPSVLTDSQGSHGTGWEFGAYYYSDAETPPPPTYGDILFWWRCQATALDALKDSSEGDTSATLTNATIAAEASLRTYDGGTNGLDCDSSSHYAAFDVNANNIFPVDGRLTMSLRIQTWVENAQIWKAYKDASNIVRVKMIGTDELQFFIKSASNVVSIDTTGLNLTTGTIYQLDFEWSATNDYIKIYKDGVLSGSAEGTMTAITFGAPTANALKIGNDSANAADIHIDLVSISDSPAARDYHDLIVTNTTEDYPGSGGGGAAATITAIGTATVAANVVTFIANASNATITDTGNPSWYIALKLSKALNVTANADPSAYRWLCGPESTDYSDATFAGYRLDAATDAYLLYLPNFLVGMRWAALASHGDGSASLQLNGAILVDGDLEPLNIDHSGLGTNLDGTGTIAGAVPYPSTTPKVFTTTSTHEAALLAGWYSVPDDNLNFAVEEDVDTDMPGTSGHEITYTGTVVGDVTIDEQYVTIEDMTITGTLNSSAVNTNIKRCKVSP